MTLKDTVNQALRVGLTTVQTEPKITFKVEPHSCGFRAGIDRDKLNQLLDQMEVEAFAAKYVR